MLEQTSKSFNTAERLATDGVIKLSICILSYNQPAAVDRLLSSLLEQCDNSVEVIIRDDSTNEETQVVVNRYMDQLPISLYRGIKEGIDRTVIFLTEKSAGEFIWWIGDDEVTPGAVKTVLSAIKVNPSVDFIWANYILVGTQKYGVDISSNECPISKDELLGLAGEGLGFISATIFRRSLGEQALIGARKYIGSLFANLYIVFYVISMSRACYYLRGPIIICHPTTSAEIKKLVLKGNGVIENRGFEVYGITYPAIIREFTASFTPSVVKRAIKKSFSHVWKGIYVGWIGGWDTPKGKKIKIFTEYWCNYQAYIALLLLSIPLPINKGLYFIYSGLKNFIKIEKAK